ncbi:MAG: rhamnulokinase family protein [Bryobacteraceae bacterium]
MSRYLAFDLGAESGRAILGTLENGRLELEELHRFLNEPVRLPDGLYWDTFRLFHDIREGLRIAGRERKLKLDGVAVDTWGVDFGLLDSNGELCLNPRHYRDPRNQAAYEEALAKVGRERIFSETGIQFMALNSLYQLYAARMAASPGLWSASRLLFMPDLFNYWLSGEQANELTIASTSQFFHPAKKEWSFGLFDALGLPKAILGRVLPPGRRLGFLLDEICSTCALDRVPVFTTASHDTASAVAAVPATGDRPWCYISSGTWSLMGVEVEDPVINEKSLEMNLTNEIGVEGRVRLLKNIAGLWIVQECRRQWLLEGKEYSYAELTEMAAGAPPFVAVIDPDQFIEPGEMPRRIAEFCRKTGQKEPESHAQFVRVALESLALRYREVLEMIEELTGMRIEVIHIVGGGSRNGLLNQFVAAATGRTVVAGPAEATAAGNILVQAMAAGEVEGLDELRRVVRESFYLETIEPSPDPAWDEGYEKYLQICRRKH